MAGEKSNITLVLKKEGRNPVVFYDKKTGSENKGRAFGIVFMTWASFTKTLATETCITKENIASLNKFKC